MNLIRFTLPRIKAGKLENNLDIGAMSLQPLRPVCVQQGSGCNVVAEIWLWFHLYNY